MLVLTSAGLHPLTGVALKPELRQLGNDRSLSETLGSTSWSFCLSQPTLLGGAPGGFVSSRTHAAECQK